MWHAWYLLKCLYFLVLDKFDRTKLNIVFYRDYRGLPVITVKELAQACYQSVLLPRSFPQAAMEVENQADAGHRIVLVTGSLDFLIRPLADEMGVDALIAARLDEANGLFTGALAGPPIGGEEKAIRIRKYAEENGVDLAESCAYGDSIADLPMLDAVGNPHVVNPDSALRRIAESRGWPIHRWTVVGGQGK
jgi:HAD superfamily hydrolase (TIGR01490 family)